MAHRGDASVLLAILCGVLLRECLCASIHSVELGDADIVCTFEKPCPFLQYDKHSWNVTEAADHNTTSPLAPPRDHTLNNASGHYIVYTNNTHGVKKTSIQIIPKLSLNNKWCLDFWYVVDGNRSNSLQVALLAGYSPAKCIEQKWFTADNPATNWTRGFFELPSGNMTLEFQAAIPDEDENGIVAIDDMRVYRCKHKTPAPPKPPAGLPRCDFERGWCGFKNDTYASLKWASGQAKVAHKKLKSRPAKDQTTGSGEGHYMYLENTKDLSSHQARIFSPQFVVPRDGVTYCAQFYFYSYEQPADVVVYNVTGEEFVRVEVGTVWRATTDAFMEWRLVITPLTPGVARLALAMEVDKLNTVGGVAIDDFRVLQCPVVRTLPPQKPSSLNQLACDFENSTCGLTNAPASALNWGRVQADHVDHPSVDVYGGSDGHFMFLNSSGAGGKGIVESASLYLFQNWCANFYYYVFATNSSQKAVLHVTMAKDTGESVEAFTSKGSVDKWRHAPMVRLLAFTNYRRLVFTGEFGEGGNAYIAVDNLVIGPCAHVIPDVTTVSPTTAEQTTTEQTTPQQTTIVQTTTMADMTTTAHGGAESCGVVRLIVVASVVASVVTSFAINFASL